LSVLKIYKSSAGSGKTYTLAANWLDLLFKDEKAYRGILAVTFTNKAAAEMKGRILETLYKLHNQDQTVAEIIRDLSLSTGLETDAIAKKAGNILHNVLNDYSAFHVETIDKFFQWVIRSFARETGLQAGYNLELNNKRILSEAVDLLMTSLDTDEQLRKWMVRFAEEKITGGKDWNFNQELLLFGEEIFKEKYQEISGGWRNAFTQKEKIDEYLKILYREIKVFEDFMSVTGENALKHITKADIEIEDFNFKHAGVAGYFNKLAIKADFDPKSRARNVLNGDENWVSKDSPKKDAVEQLVKKHLHHLLETAVSYFDAHFVLYNTARTILSNVYSFGILTDIYLKIREIASEKNLFMLSDASVFLRRIIANNDTPFIYEKAGNYFHHFMLDEFQDTSGYQWDNLFPLLLNGLASDRESLIVGDVKQSIYRWRNSDWKILASQAEKSFAGFNLEIIPLDTNWRSFRSIVSFNNTLFLNLSKKLSDVIETDSEAGKDHDLTTRWKETVHQIYANAAQLVSIKNMNSTGYVEMVFLDSNKEDYLDEIDVRLPLLILDIQSRGYKPGDIVILVRKAAQGRDIASVLMQYAATHNETYRFNVISNDSLFIDSHPSVRFIISLLHYLTNPDDNVNIAFLHHEYLRYLSDYEVDDLVAEKIFGECGHGIAIGLHDAFDDFLKELESIRQLPLFELVEDIIRRFGLTRQKDNIAFIQALQDIILNFVNEDSSDAGAFLNWWDQNGSSQTLNVSEAQDAIRILTIHKAKGLQFPVVIVPFCDWNLDAEPNTTNYLWCKNNDVPFSMIEYVPVKYRKDLVNTYFRNDYLNEKFHNYIDNINLLYVALTRPVEELYVFANCKNKSSVASFIMNALTSAEDTHDNSGFTYANLHMSNGEPSGKIISGEKGVSAGKPSGIVPEFIQDYPLTDNHNKLKLNTRNVWLEIHEKDYKQKLGYGTVMHEILSRIETHRDIENSVKKAYLQGKIPEGEVDAITRLLTARISGPVVIDWFNGSWKVMKEKEICIARKAFYRPDRVMIKDDSVEVVDYKFGDEKYEKYKKQVRIYIEALKEVGYVNCRGWLWFFNDNSLMEVK